MSFRIRDDRQRDLLIARPPQRIVSLVPSDTETLFALGLGDRVVGRTRYCIEPAGQVENIPICGGTKDIDVDAVKELSPDLILANQEENSRPPLEALAGTSAILFVSFPRRVAEGISHVARLARILGIAAEPAVRDLIRQGHHAVRDATTAIANTANAANANSTLETVFMPIWKDPLMTLNGDTFGSDMLTMIGARNAFADRQRRYPLAADLGNMKIGDHGTDGNSDGRDTRYPRVPLDEVRSRAPSAVFLPDEPHDFTTEDGDWFARELGIARERIKLVDGKDLFWYGVRSIYALPRLRALIESLPAA